MTTPNDQKLRAALAAGEERFKQYASKGAEAGALRNIKLLRAVLDKGLEAVLARRSSVEAREEVAGLVELFGEIGPSAVLLTGSQRGGDFLNNQLRGRWAESVCCSMQLPRHVLRPFGPSGAAMPGDDDHARVVRAYGEITLLEGKRPDLLALDRTWWDGAAPAHRTRVETWPDRLLERADDELMSHARAGVEVKTSVWHYGARRAAGGGPLAITVKEEELASLTNWSETTGCPVLFFQVLFDEVYCMSFRRMLRGRREKRVYAAGDYAAEKDRKTGKDTHRFFVNGAPHLCAKTVFPDKSEAHVPVLPGGYVIPHVRLAPAQATDVLPEVIEAELAYVG